MSVDIQALRQSFHHVRRKHAGLRFGNGMERFGRDPNRLSGKLKR
jgi:hypothetical protein